MMLHVLLGILFAVLAVIMFLYTVLAVPLSRDRRIIVLFVAVTCATIFVLLMAVLLAGSFWFQAFKGLAISIFLFGSLLLYTSISGLLYSLNRPFQHWTTRYPAICGLVFFLMLSTLVIADLVSGIPRSFILVHTDQDVSWSIIQDPFAGVLTLLAVLSATTAVASALGWRKQTGEPGYGLLAGLMTLLLTVFMAGAALVLPALPLELVITVNAASLTFLFSVIAYCSRNDPFFAIMTRNQYRLLLDRGFIGYVLAAYLDGGPEPLLIAPALKDRLGLPETHFLKMSLGLMMISGLFDRGFDRVSIIPVPSAEKMAIVTYTFVMKNPTAADSRLVENTDVLFTLIVPSPLLQGMRDVSTALPVILEEVNYRETIGALIDESLMEKLSIRVLDKLLG